MKKVFLIFVSITLLLALALLIRFSFGGSEDTWVCQNGAWIKRGTPAAPMPTALCEAEPLPPATK